MAFLQQLQGLLGASSNVTVALTGVAMAANAGSLSSAKSTALAGVALALALSNPSPNLSLATSGQSLVAVQGSTVAAMTQPLTGVAAALASGNVTTTAAPALSGQSLTLARGALSPVATLGLTGFAMPTGQGAVLASADVTRALTGQSLSVGQGSLAASVSRALGGQALSTGQGTVVAVTNVTVALSGQSLSVARGTLAPAYTTSLSGQALGAGAGAFSASEALGLAGQNVALSSGSAVAASSTALFGVGAALAQGTMQPIAVSTTFVALTGQSLSLSRGFVYASGATSDGGGSSGACGVPHLVVQPDPTTVAVDNNAARAVVAQRVTGVGSVTAKSTAVRVGVAPPPAVATVKASTDTVAVAGMGQRGPAGPAGADGTVATVSYVSDHPGTLTRGMAVCLISGMLRRASSISPFNKVIGFVYEDAITQGMAGRVQTDGNISTTALQWDDATGMTGGLSSNSVYFLTSTSAITPYAETTLGRFVAPVGTALSSTVLRIELNTQILL